MGDEIAGYGCGSGECHAPEQVGQDDLHGPVFEGGQVGEIVGGVGEEAEKRAVEQGVAPGFFFDGGQDAENENADDEKEVKHNGCGPVDLLAEQVAEVAIVHAFSDEAEPDEVYGKENEGGEQIAEQELKKWHRMCFENGTKIMGKVHALHTEWDFAWAGGTRRIVRTR